MHNSVSNPSRTKISDSAGTNQDNIEIYGTPVSRDKSDLIDQYNSLCLNDYLKAEATTSVGSYRLVHTMRDRIRIITSIGYTGGYIYCDKEQTAVSETVVGAHPNDPELTGSDVSDGLLLHYYRHGPLDMFPFSTPFDSIINLVPGSVVEISAQGIECYYNYIANYQAEKSFTEQLEHTVELIYKGTDNDVKVLFSGGVDSTAILIACQKMASDDKVEAISLFTGNMGGNPLVAAEISHQLGNDISLIDGGMPPKSASALKRIKNIMKCDFISPGNPQWALADAELSSDAIVLHGEGMDNILTSGMSRHQLSRWNRVMNAPIRKKVEAILADPLRYDVPNIQRTDEYLENKTVRSGYLAIMPIIYTVFNRLVSKVYGKSPLKNFDEYSTDASFEGVLKGMLTTQYPNYTSDPMLKKNISKEIKLFVDYMPNDSSKRDLFDAINFYSHVKNAIRMVSKYNPQENVNILPLTISGPISSSNIGYGKNIQYAFRPKKEVYDYVKQETGQSYFDLRSYYTSTGETQADIDWAGKISRKLNSFDRGKMESPLVDEYADLLDDSASNVIPLINDSKIKQEVKNIYRKSRKSIDKSTLELGELRRAYRIINIELMFGNL